MRIVDDTPVEAGQVRAGIGGTCFVVVRARLRRDGSTPTGYWDVLDHAWIAYAASPWTARELKCFRVLGAIEDDDLVASWGLGDKRRAYRALLAGRDPLTS